VKEAEGLFIAHNSSGYVILDALDENHNVISRTYMAPERALEVAATIALQVEAIHAHHNQIVGLA
jgi:hypothetical protein